MRFNYSKLRGKIKELGYSEESVAQKIGISPSSFNNKLNGKTNLSSKEIYLISNLLNISDGEFIVYFFSPLVQVN